MPSKARSINTGAHFHREDRYIVIKRSDLDRLERLDRHLFSQTSRRAHEQMFAAGAPARQFLVLESDWPEFEPTWAAIEARITGKPAEQQQGEPVAVLYANGTVLTKTDCGDVFDICCKVETPLYTHADPGEVERLRAEVKRLELAGSQSDYSYDMDRDHMSGRINLLEDLVGKFVRNCEKHKLHLSDIPALSGVRWYLKRFEAALSASAEREVPRSEPEKPSRCTSCGNCRGFNIGHDSSQQKPHSIRCDNCHKEARAADHDGLARAWSALNQSE